MSNPIKKRQSYDIEIEAMIEETGCKSDNTLDLKNPYFRYNGAVPQVPTTTTTPNHTQQHDIVIKQQW